MEAKFMEMLQATYAKNAANANAARATSAGLCSDDDDGDKKMPAKEPTVPMDEDERGTESNSGSHKPGATGGAKAGGDISQTGETGGAPAGMK
jgi:hypothetical protein